MLLSSEYLSLSIFIQQMDVPPHIYFLLSFVLIYNINYSFFLVLLPIQYNIESILWGRRLFPLLQFKIFPIQKYIKIETQIIPILLYAITDDSDG